MKKLIRWKPEDDNWLREFYNQLSFDEIKSKFSLRTDDAIRRRAKDLGLTKKRADDWTDEEVEMLFTDMSNSEISELTHRSISAIVKKRIIEQSRRERTSQIDGYKDLFDLSAIESNVPNINKFSKSSHHYALLLALKVGDSYEYPTNEDKIVRNQIILLPDRGFTTKKWSEETRRVWRKS